VGVMLDKFGPRTTMAVSAVLTVAGCIVFGFQYSLVGGYALFGLGKQLPSR